MEDEILDERVNNRLDNLIKSHREMSKAMSRAGPSKKTAQLAKQIEVVVERIREIKENANKC